jgi:hypothetical protein
MLNRKALCRGMVAALLVSASTSLYAVTTTYNYTITGDVVVGDESFANAFGLTAGETITAYGTFTADSSVFSGAGGTVSFDGISNTMTIDLNGTLISALNAVANPSLTFDTSGLLIDFDYLKTSADTFNSSFLAFDDLDLNLYGEWRADAAVTAVPEAETYAMMLAGLGLVGWMGAARRKSLQRTV